MVDRMDVDSKLADPVMSQHEPPDPLLLLRESLPPFINKNISYALGDEYVPDFAPPEDATLPELLRHILDKWLSVFQNSALSSYKSCIQSLLKLSLDLDADTKRLSNLARRLLVAIGKSSLALRSASKDPVPRSAIAPPALISGTTRLSGPLQPVILDGPNISWRHSNGTRFSIRGTAEAVHYFSTRGHPTVLILPEARLEGVDSKHPEDAPFFQAVKNLGRALVTTPDQEYDDAYICDLARRNCAVVVSNDRFRDHIYQMEAVGEEVARSWTLWLNSCRLGFTFAGDQFVPNPAFNWERAARVGIELRLPS
eukprot:GFKZ01007518.1.p1 GENE.GFKZ01007518.1~~GFKZ01007518.1.p1  ORF type:complete len:364 (+),score=38.70 GFKZ01007518.1:159-1094(+)